MFVILGGAYTLSYDDCGIFGGYEISAKGTVKKELLSAEVQ